jgi:hypothetical protein
MARIWPLFRAVRTAVAPVAVGVLTGAPRPASPLLLPLPLFEAVAKWLTHSPWFL